MPENNGTNGFLGWLRPARRTVRLRLTLLQGVLFLVSGAGTIGITYALAVAEFPALVTQGPRGLSQPGGEGVGPLGPIPSHHESAQAAQHAADLKQFLIESGIALAVVVTLSIGLGWLVAGRILRPLRTMTASTRQIFEDNLHERLPVEGPQDELKEMGDTINGLLSRLEAAFDAQRRFVANASHELRTPITLERAMLEVALSDPAATVDSLRATCQEVLLASRQQERLIDALLTLARSQRGLDHWEVFDLATVTGAVLRTVRSGPGVPVVRASLHAIGVSGDQRLVERLVVNLVDNAMRYNVPDGTVDVIVAADAGRGILTVQNTGPVTPADQIERLLQPFQRLTGRRGGQGGQDGLGLGLSIVDAIVKAHGATLNVRPGPQGGLRIEIAFPVAPVPRVPNRTHRAGVTGARGRRSG